MTRGGWRAAAWGLCAAAVAAWGCSGEVARDAVTETGAEEASIRDSAGVRIVENGGAPSAWRVAPEPILEVGAAVGAPGEEAAHQLDRVAGALRLPDERIAVADGGSSEVRFFDPDGTFVGRTGGPGDGPGEFRLIESMGRGSGDSLWVYDFALQRLSFLDGTGEFARAAPLMPPLPNLGAVGRLPDGSLVLAQYWSSAGAPEGATGLRRLPAVVARYASDGALLDTVGRFPGREVFLRLEGGRMTMGAVPFARTTSRAVSGGMLWIGDQTGHELRAYGVDGTLRRVVRFPGPELRLTPEEVRRAKSRWVREAPEEEREYRREYAEVVELPPARPAYLHFVPDPAGRLWVSEFASSPRELSRWRVFDRDGRLRAEVATPPGLRIHDVGEGWVLGVREDALGIQHVALHALEKEAPLP